MKTKILISAMALALSGAAFADEAGKHLGTDGGPEAATPGTQMGAEPMPSPAAPEEVAAGTDFTSLDTDGDGYISKEEASADVQDRWETADTNADGKLDQSEFSALETTEPAGSMDQPDDASGKK